MREGFDVIGPVLDVVTIAKGVGVRASARLRKAYGGGVIQTGGGAGVKRRSREGQHAPARGVGPRGIHFLGAGSRETPRYHIRV